MEKLYPESVVKELIRQTIEMTMQQLNISSIAHALYPDHKGKFEITGIKSPALEGGIDQSKLLFNFFVWFRENGEETIGGSIEKMIETYLKEEQK